LEPKTFIFTTKITKKEKIKSSCTFMNFVVYYSGFQKYVPFDSRLSFRTHRGSIWSVLWLTALKLKNSTSLCSGLKQLQFLRSASPRTLNQISPNEFARKLRRCIQSLKWNVILRTTIIKCIFYKLNYTPQDAHESLFFGL